MSQSRIYNPRVAGGGGGGGDNIDRVEYRTITAPEIAAKSLTLAFTPLSDSAVKVDAVGGTAQVLGADFSVAGQIVSWSGLGLDGLVAEGDILRINYQTSS